MPHLAILSVNRDPCGRPGDPASGGQVKYIFGLTRHMAGLGWSIDIFTAQWTCPEPSTEITDSVKVYRFALPDGTLNVNDLSVEGCWSIGQRILEHQTRTPDISLSCFWQSVPAGLLLKRKQGVPAAVTFCSLGQFKLEHMRRQGIAVSPAFHERLQIENLGVAEMDAIIATSSTEKNALKNYYNAPKGKIHVIPRGIDFELFHERYSTAIHSQT